MSTLLGCKLGNVVKFGNGKSRPSTEGIFPIYGGNGILGYTSENNYEGETIVIGRVGAYCGATYYENRKIWVSDNALSAKPKGKNNAKFLYFFLKNLDLNTHAQGSSHPLVTQTLLNSIDIEITEDPNEQKAIADLLSSLDDKIDLLHRQNRTLDAMVETLFRQWFVEEAKEDWKEYSVSDFATHSKTNVVPTNQKNELFHHYSLPAFDQGKYPTIELGNEILSNKYKVAANSILVSKLNPRVPRIWPIGNLDYVNAICSTEFQVLLPKSKKLYGYLYSLLRSSDAVDSLTMAASGTSGSHQRVRPEDILNIKTTLPSIERAEEFSTLVASGIEKSRSNINQILTLQKLRDILLPKLMSGEVRVKL